MRKHLALSAAALALGCIGLIGCEMMGTTGDESAATPADQPARPVMNSNNGNTSGTGRDYEAQPGNPVGAPVDSGSATTRPSGM